MELFSQISLVGIVLQETVLQESAFCFVRKSSPIFSDVPTPSNDHGYVTNSLRLTPLLLKDPDL